MASIHPTAVVDPKAQIGEDVYIGPYCVVGPGASLGAGCRLHSHVVVDGQTQIGEGTKVYSFAALGLPPQDLKYQDEPSRLEIGAGCTIREHATVNPGTRGGGMITRVGEGCLLMIGAHVAHDCQVGKGVIMANNATLAGHVSVGDGAVIGGLAAVLQFVRIGEGAMIGGMSGVEQDVIPYGLVMGERASLHGLNIIGLKRAQIGVAELKSLRQAFDVLFHSPERTLAERAKDAMEGGGEVTRRVAEFILAESKHGILKPDGDQEVGRS